jgi:hypothetical protein
MQLYHTKQQSHGKELLHLLVKVHYSSLFRNELSTNTTITTYREAITQEIVELAKLLLESLDPGIRMTEINLYTVAFALALDYHCLNRLSNILANFAADQVAIIKEHYKIVNYPTTVSAIPGHLAQ